MSTLIVTGASRGIGRATALALSEDFDYTVIISRKSLSELENLKTEINAKGGICLSYLGDVSDYGFVKNTISDILEHTGSIDVLINNAGVSITGLFTDTTPEEWQDIIGSNLTSVYNTCHCTVPHMIHRKQGKIINISSIWGICGASCEVAYSATKGAINSFTMALAKELGPSHISVNAVAFGAIDTSMNEHLTAEEKASLEYEIPYGRMATPEEAAICIKNIINMPSYLTGEIIKFDGAFI